MFHSRVLWSSVFLFKGQSPVQVKIPGSFVCRCVTVFIFEISAWLLVTSKSCSFGFAVFSLHILHFNIRGFVTCLAFEFTVINSSVCLSGFSHRCDSFHKFECLILCSLLCPHTHTHVQPYTGDDEEQTGPLPPNPFSELSEKELEDYQKRVERQQLGVDGKTRSRVPHTSTVLYCLNTYVYIIPLGM